MRGSKVSEVERRFFVLARKDLSSWKKATDASSQKSLLLAKNPSVELKWDDKKQAYLDIEADKDE